MSRKAILKTARESMDAIVQLFIGLMYGADEIRADSVHDLKGIKADMPEIRMCVIGIAHGDFIVLYAIKPYDGNTLVFVGADANMVEYIRVGLKEDGHDWEVQFL